MTPIISEQKILVTGGAGFIGSHLVEYLLSKGNFVTNLDLLTYAGNLENLVSISGHPHYKFQQGNIGDKGVVKNLLEDFRPDIVFNLAAESHVDRSIEDSSQFIETNITGVYRLLAAVLEYWRGSGASSRFRFIQMSTDEVFGSIAAGAADEEAPYLPNSPYAASKAAGDHLVRAFHKTYGLPAIIVRASNTFGPRQFPEKFIPHIIISALRDRMLPVYGRGLNVRDWLYVGDLVRGLGAAANNCSPGESFNFAGGNQWKNIDTVNLICNYLDKKIPRVRPYATSIQYVEDRPGHDLRYAMSADKAAAVFSWKPETQFDQGLETVVDWYLTNKNWWQAILARGYDGTRIGLGVR